MKILIIDSYYPKFLKAVINDLTRDIPDYSLLLDRINKLRFGTSDFYSKNLILKGNEVEDIVFNCEYLQRQWLKENNNLSKSNINIFNRVFNKLKSLSKDNTNDLISLEDIAVRQIKKSRPDILYLQDLNLFKPEILNQLRNEGVVKLVVGQIACPLPPIENLKAFDLILTSFPHYVKKFRELNINSEYLKIAFDPIVNSEIKNINRGNDCTFIGGISPAHSERLIFLERLAREVDMKFYGYGAETLDNSSEIKSRHYGEVWGLDMYRALTKSAITLNIHIDVAENYANNMRLYEATGCGALLLTDMKDNLNELFKIDEEIVTYRSIDEAVEKIRYFSKHPIEARKIALAGQKRTLNEHTYQNRMSDLNDILESYLNNKK